MTVITAGFVAPEVAAEHPQLRLDHVTVPARVQPSPPAVRRRLAQLSDRSRGARVIAERARPISQAHRAFHRQIGLDPDVDRIPSERAAAERLLHGGYRSRDAIADACLIGLAETGVGVWALDAAIVDQTPPGLGIRLAAGALVVADARTVHATLLDDPLPGHEPRRATREVTLFAVGVPGVPVIHREEALWLAADALGAQPSR